MGISLANEALLMGRKITVQEMLKHGFVSKVIEPDTPNQQNFLDSVLHDLERIIGDHLHGSSLLGIKALIQAPEQDVISIQNLAEVFVGMDRLTSGAVDREMDKIQKGSKRQKL